MSSKRGTSVSRLWEGFLARLLSRSERPWASSADARTSDEPTLFSSRDTLEEDDGALAAQETDPETDSQLPGDLPADIASMLERSTSSSDDEGDGAGAAHEVTLQTGEKDSATAADLLDSMLGSSSGEPQLQADSNGRTTPADSQAQELLAGHAEGAEQSTSSKLSTLQPDPEVSLTSLIDALLAAAPAPYTVAADPVLAAELVSQAPLPSGGRIRLIEHEAELVEIPSWPADTAAPSAAPVAAPQACHKSLKACLTSGVVLAIGTTM